MPNSLSKLAHPAGLEPATSRLEVGGSQLRAAAASELHDLVHAPAKWPHYRPNAQYLMTLALEVRTSHGYVARSIRRARQTALRHMDHTVGLASCGQANHLRRRSLPPRPR